MRNQLTGFNTGGYIIMLGKNWTRKSLAIITTLAVWSVFSMVALAAPKDTTAEISVTGQVTVNGNPITVNTTIASDSTITTGANSSAVVSLGKLGRVELQGDSSVKLTFSGNSIVSVLNAGKVRVSNASGVAATVTTKDAAIVGDTGQANTFEVEVECSHTHANTIAGLVTMRSGSTDKPVAAGADSIAGNMEQTGCQPCKRPGGDRGAFPVAGLSGGALAAIILATLGAAGAAIFFGTTGNNDVTSGGGAVIISPSR
jgi:hypothetical protein